MSNPYEAPKSPENPFGEQFPDTQPQSAGLVNQVQIVCILMIVQGALVTCMGLFYVGYAFVFPAVFRAMEASAPAGAQAPPAEMTWIMMAVMLVIGIPVLLSGPLLIWAGIRNLRFRGRVLGLVALIASVVTVVTCYCAPTGIGLMAYGLIVYMNPEVIQAFQMGERGASRNQILAAYWPYRPGGPQPPPPKPAES